MKGAISHPRVPQNQADAYINQAAPVSGTKYEWSSDGTQTNKLGDLSNVRILSIIAQCTYTVVPTSLEVHITIDGVVLTASNGAPTSAVPSYVTLSPASAQPGLKEALTFTADNKLFLEGRSIKIEVEVTGGTVSNLSGRVKYAKW